jgi:biotin carboxyl carrier protein
MATTRGASDRELKGSDRAALQLAGERTNLVERVIVATETGRFHPLPEQVVGRVVTRGETIGMIGQRRESRPVVSRFTGRIIDMLVHPGEHVRNGEPIAWLRVT